MGGHTDKQYTREFYAELQEGSRRSARQIVPLILQLVECSSVIDVGCGSGEWLAVFKEFGVEEVLGIDGAYVDPNILQIPSEHFLARDLSKALNLEHRFDLAMSLEVAEHLSHECAEIFVSSLTRLSEVVLFSAAVPFQEGTNHINERWPEYWVRLFRQNGFVVIDCLRRELWEDDDVDWWYRQNSLIFVNETALDRYPKLRDLYLAGGRSQPLSLVHPKLYLYHVAKSKELSRVVERRSVRALLLFLNWYERVIRRLAGMSE
jgi:SAM-dependent methyltransferase